MAALPAGSQAAEPKIAFVEAAMVAGCDDEEKRTRNGTQCAERCKNLKVAAADIKRDE